MLDRNFQLSYVKKCIYRSGPARKRYLVINTTAVEYKHLNIS